MEELKIYNFNLAVALLTYGIPFKYVKNDQEGKLYYVFEPSVNTHNVLILYGKQEEFLKDKTEFYKHLIGSKIRSEKTKFGGIKDAYKESTKKIKGTPQKTNGVWKA